MKRAIVIVAGFVAACELPPLTLKFTLTDGKSQQCVSDTGIETTSCEDIEMICDGVLSVRVVPPSAPDFPYISVCQRLRSTDNLCSIAGVDLARPEKPIPEQVLEVQMAVFAGPDLRALVHDGQYYNPATDQYTCPQVKFAANNLPLASACPMSDTSECAPRPAVGGRSFYYPGDEETLVKLGCTEITLLNGETCEKTRKTQVIASVNEFGSLVGVDEFIANRLFVSVGEPRLAPSGSHELPLSATRALTLDPTAAVPTWRAEVEVDTFPLSNSFCIEVLEDTFQATRTLTCRKLTSGPNPDLINGVGIHLYPFDLEKILRAYNGDGSATFPPKGLVLGIILDDSFAPVTNATVSVPNMTCGTTTVPRPCAIKYLSGDGLAFNGTSTSVKGIFISDEAPYGSEFVWSGQVQPTLGGVVAGKVTIVVIQESGIGNL